MSSIKPSTTSSGQMRKFANGLTLPCLLLCAACSMAPQLPPSKEIQKQFPPSSLLQPSDLPPTDIRTNGDLAAALQSCRAVVAACNVDKEALRAWAAQ